MNATITNNSCSHADKQTFHAAQLVYARALHLTKTTRIHVAYYNH